MPNTPTKLLLFLSSYSPVWVILALRFWNVQPMALILAVLGVLSGATLYLFVLTVQKTSATVLTLEQARSRDADVVGYLVGYLLPFLDLDLADGKDVAALGAFLAVIAVLYVHSNLIYINQLLAVIRYHLHEVEADGHSFVLLSKRHFLPAGTQVRVVRLGGGLRMEKSS